MDKVSSVLETGFLWFMLLVFTLAVIGWVVSKVTVKVPDGHVGFYVDKHATPDSLTPMLKAGDMKLKRPFYRLHSHPIVTVAEGCVGLVYANFGVDATSYHSPSHYSTGMGDFTDPQAFTKAGGSSGYQEVILPAGSYAIDPYAFAVVVIGAGQPKVFGTMEPSVIKAVSEYPPLILTDAWGNLKLVVEPYLADPDDEDRDHDWTVAQDGSLVESCTFGLLDSNKIGSVVINIMFPEGGGTLAQLFVNSTIRAVFDREVRTGDPYAFVASVRRLQNLLTEMDSEYQLSITRASLQLQTAKTLNNPNS